ncbi:MAG: hypothetical protein ACK4J0_01415, partial [Candidatus Anstonellaceae archaeon]
LDIGILPFALITGVIVFFIFYILYKLGQVGGADGYILSAIAMTIPVQPKSFLLFEGIFLLPFILNLFVFASVSFIVYMLVSTIPKVLKNFSIKKEDAINVLIILVFYLFFLFFVFQNSFIFSLVGPGYIIVLTCLILVLSYYTLFKEIINNSMIEFVDVKNIEPEDIIAIDKMDKELVKKYSLSRLVSKEQYERMKAIKGKKIALFKHLPPFLPHVLIGLICSLFFGDLITLVVNLF